MTFTNILGFSQFFNIMNKLCKMEKNGRKWRIGRKNGRQMKNREKKWKKMENREKKWKKMENREKASITINRILFSLYKALFGQYTIPTS